MGIREKINDRPTFTGRPSSVCTSERSKLMIMSSNIIRDFIKWLKYFRVMEMTIEK